MYSNSTFQVTSVILENAYNSNLSRLNDSMGRISSGKRIARPVDGIPEYFHIRQFKADLSGLDHIKSNIVYGQGFVKAADQTGGYIWQKLNRLMEMTKEYYSTNSAEEQTAKLTEFRAIKQSIVDTVNLSKYGERKLVADGGGTPALKIVVDPRDILSTFNIEYGSAETVDPTGLNLGSTGFAAESAALQTQIDKAGNYLGRTSAYSAAIDMYYDMTQKKIVEWQKNVERTEKIDEGAEMMKFTKQGIQQQMTVAMMAQANLFKNAIVALVTGK